MLHERRAHIYNCSSQVTATLFALEMNVYQLSLTVLTQQLLTVLLISIRWQV